MKTAMATIRLKSTEAGGKNQAIGQGGDYSCPTFFQEIPALSSHAFDCRLMLRRDNRTIAPGETANDVFVGFLSPDVVFPHLKLGTSFVLWEGRPIGEGEITDLPT